MSLLIHLKVFFFFVCQIHSGHSNKQIAIPEITPITFKHALTIINTLYKLSSVILFTVKPNHAI